MSQIWRILAEGYAEGPARIIKAADGRDVRLASYWTDEEGVSVLVEAGDEPLPADVARRVAVDLMHLSSLTAPELSA